MTDRQLLDKLEEVLQALLRIEAAMARREQLNGSNKPVELTKSK